MNYLEDYYNNYDEEGRLLSRHGQVEYLTTMRYIEACLEGISDPGILEVGAGTGRYSVTLAKQGLRVTAVDLVEHNLELLRSKLDGTEPITSMRGNALDLTVFPDCSFDLTMLLGPMYHLYTKEEKRRALSEAVRVTKRGGHILVAYCMNEPTVIQYVFGMNKLHEVMDLKMLTSDWHCISEPKDLLKWFVRRRLPNWMRRCLSNASNWLLQMVPRIINGNILIPWTMKCLRNGWIIISRFVKDRI